jgi:hypothetical protein
MDSNMMYTQNPTHAMWRLLVIIMLLYIVCPPCVVLPLPFPFASLG